jgi:hypothetical protein
MTRELRNVAKAADKAATASASRDDAIRAAHTAGNTIRAIAATAGLSASRVHQILHGR